MIGTCRSRKHFLCNVLKGSHVNPQRQGVQLKKIACQIGVKFLENQICLIVEKFAVFTLGKARKPFP